MGPDNNVNLSLTQSSQGFRLLLFGLEATEDTDLDGIIFKAFLEIIVVLLGLYRIFDWLASACPQQQVESL